MDKSNEIILDVFEIEDYDNPVLTYRISVVDRVIISVSNNGINTPGKVLDNVSVLENLEISELTKIERLKTNDQLTHKFQINDLGWKNLYLNLTDNDLIKLGFIEPKQVIGKTEKLWIWIKKFHKAILWVLGGILLLLSIMVAGFEVYDRLNKQTEQKESTQPINKQNIDDNNVSKTDSLTKKLK